MFVSTEDIINTIRSLDKIKSAAKSIRTALKQVDFKLKDTICDVEELKQLRLNTKTPDELLTFFSEFDIKKTKLIEEYRNKTVPDDVKNDVKNDQFPGKYSKSGSLFQIMIYTTAIKKCHDTAITLLQVKPSIPVNKPPKS